MTTTPTTVTPPSTPTVHPFFHSERIAESWCDLNVKSGCSSAGSSHPLNQSINPEILHKLLQDAQRDTTLPHAIVISSSNQPSTSISVQSSPKSPQTPNVLLMHRQHQLQREREFQARVQQQQQQQQPHEQQFVHDQLGNTTQMMSTYEQNNLHDNVAKMGSATGTTGDWMWYWSSRPQAQPPKEWNFVHPNSSLSKYSLRNTQLMESKFLNRDVMKNLILSHLASFILGATL